jgi:hypothetical protein
VTTSPARAAAAARKRRHRARQRDGLVVLPVVAPEIDLAKRLEADGFGQGLEDDRGALARALEARIRRWIEGRDASRRRSR